MNKQEPKTSAAMPINKELQRVGPRPNGLKQRAGKIKYGCLAWMIGLPLPIVIILLFYKGCDF